MTSSGHDILVMSGNGHIAQIKIRINVNKLIEVMSSHVSNLTGINNLTADKTKQRLDSFLSLTPSIFLTLK